IMEVESPEQIGYDRVRVNLAESSMRDRTLAGLGMDPGELSGLLLQYADHRGFEGARSAIAADGDGIAPDDVLLTVGAAGALFLAATALLEPGDRLVVAAPNYASNLETPRAIGAEIVPLNLRFDEGWRVDLDRLTKSLTSNTKLVSLTTPHNPTGAEIPWDDLRVIARMVERAGAWLLVDETYRELASEPLPLAASLGERVISVSSLSKTYGVPGIRVGWAVCRDETLMTSLLAAQEQAALSHSVLDMAVAEWLLARRDSLLPEIRAQVMRRRAMVHDWIASDGRFEWAEPTGGVVCFPRIADPAVDARAYVSRLQADGIFVGPGWWFEQSERHFRLGYGFPADGELADGLSALSAALDDVS
ncbi:MAG: pyridoxal phosphate-dependent aminotransferase, partial [Thermomicrobiales bacterium]